MSTDQIFIYSDDPKQMLSDIYDGINKNKIRTWKVDSSNQNSFFHTGDSNQWTDARLVPQAKFENDKNEKRLHLILKIVSNTNKKSAEDLAGIYLGRFSELVISHFNGKVTKVLIL